MKKILMAAVAVSGLAATPAMAADSATYDVTGTVTAVCSVNSGTTIAFTGLTDGSGSIVAGAVTNIAGDTGAYCNGGNSKLSVTHSPLKLQAGAEDSTVTPPTGFVKTIEFTPVVKVGDLATEYNDGGAHAVGAFSGLSVQAKAPTVTGGKPLAGDYKGSITIAVSPTA